MIDSKAALTTYLIEDFAWYGADGWKSRFRVTNRRLYFHLLLRRCEYWRNCRPDPVGKLVYLILRMRLQFLSERLGFDIPLNVFGPGLSIAHAGTVIVNSKTRVGTNCRLHPGVTLGAIGELAPTLGDEVFLAPGAGVFGGVHVGDRCHLGPNTTVTTDLPPDSLVLPNRPTVRPLTRATWQQSQRSELPGTLRRKSWRKQ